MMKCKRKRCKAPADGLFWFDDAACLEIIYEEYGLSNEPMTKGAIKLKNAINGFVAKRNKEAKVKFLKLIGEEIKAWKACKKALGKDAGETPDNSIEALEGLLEKVKVK